MSTENYNAQAARAASFLTRLLSGWGVPGGIARILAGAIIGALAALYALSAAGGPAGYSQNAAGDRSFSGSVVLPDPLTITPTKEDGYEESYR